MGVVDLGTPQKSREEWITGNPLFLYGAMQVALDLYFASNGDPDLDVLGAFAGAKGHEFLSLDNELWKNIGVMQPVFDLKSQKIRSWRVTNSLQTRRAMATATIHRFRELP